MVNADWRYKGGNLQCGIGRMLAPGLRETVGGPLLIPVPGLAVFVDGGRDGVSVIYCVDVEAGRRHKLAFDLDHRIGRPQPWSRNS